MPALDRRAFTQRLQDALERLATTTGVHLGHRWDSLGHYGDEQRWVDLAGPVLTAAQNRAIDLQVAYLQRILAERVPFDRAALLKTAQIDITEPFIAFANALDSGNTFEQAVLSGRLRAEGIGESGTHWASRAANTAVRRPMRWQRVLSGGACEWCQMVAGQTYASAESASFGHLHCSCGVVPADS